MDEGGGVRKEGELGLDLDLDSYDAYPLDPDLDPRHWSTV